MANICSFEMKVKGKKEDIEQFCKAMTYEGKIRIGGGAEFQVSFEDDNVADLSGYCNWSIRSALIDRCSEKIADYEYINLFEACKKWSLAMEVYSEECGMAFQEHFVCNKGEILCEECVDWHEYAIYEYKTKEEAERDLEVEITDNEWESGEEYIQRGGFEEWNFDLSFSEEIHKEKKNLKQNKKKETERDDR